jgi:WD40 repeat protein/tRNA A-37 threonylcarbamoyl transferase component Bud32
MTIELKSTTHCPDCGSTLPAGPLTGLCPQCLLDSTLSSQTSSAGETSPPIPFAPSLPCRFAQYQLLEIVGRGAAGTVFRARDESLNREVAIKALHSGPLASRESIRRFFNEARVAARLSHPHIAPVYEVAGGDQLQPFVVMPFLPGGNLAEKLKKPLINTQLQLGVPSTPPPGNCFKSFQSIAQLLHKIASAVHHAHQHGVLHRDLKPANILFDSAGQPYVADFGLARVLEEESTLTLENTLLGTPAYMSPEQATGSGEFSVASDIYSLGAILYELLTGHPPFVAPTIAATLRAIVEELPAFPPSKSAFRTPHSAIDLETICLKCLEKDPAKRYPTAEALAEDLQRYLDNEPISARPISRAGKLIRWSQRNPALATAYSLLLLLIFIGLIGSPLVIYRINNARKAEVVAHQRAVAQAYSSDMNLAYQAWLEGDLAHGQQLVRAQVPTAGENDLRGFEWRFLCLLLRDQSEATFPGITSTIALSSNEQLLAVGTENRLLILNPTNLVTIEEIMPGDRVTAVAISSDNNFLAAAGATNGVQVWNLQTRSRIASWPGRYVWHCGLSFSPNGRFLAGVGNRNLLTVWDLLAGTELWSSNCIAPPCVARFSPDSTKLVSGGATENPLIWNIQTAECSSFPHINHGWTVGLDFSPNGQTLATSSYDGTITLWNYAARAPVARMNGTIQTALSFSRDGHLLVTAGEDGTIRFWDIATRREIARLRGHASDVLTLAFPVDGGRLLSSSADGTIKSWRIPNLEEPEAGCQKLGRPANWVHSVSISPDAHFLASIDLHDHKLTVWNLPRRTIVTNIEGAFVGGTGCFSPDGRTFVTSSTGQLSVFDVPSFSPRAFLTNRLARSYSLSFSPDSRFIAGGGADFVIEGEQNRLAIWDLASQEQTHRLQMAGTNACAVAFSHNGHWLAIGYYNGFVRVWDLKTERPIAAWHVHSQLIWNLSFSPDDSVLASAGQDARIGLYNLRSGQAYPPLSEEHAQVWVVQFSPDGKTLASASQDGLLKFWNLLTLRSALTIRPGVGPVTTLSFDPTGDLLATSGADGVLRLWPASAEPL